MPALRYGFLCCALIAGEVLRADDETPTLAELANNLIQACYNGSEPEAKQWLARGADPNSRVERWAEQTPLNAAAAAGSLEVVKLLLERGARSGTADSYGRTPLHVAASRWKPEWGDEVEKLLLDSGAQVNAKDSGGMTPLAYAARNGSEGMRFLLEAGAMADRSAILEAASFWRLDAIELLLQRGVPLRDPEPGKPTLMHAVAEARGRWYGAPKMDGKELRHLLDRLHELHVPVDDADGDGATPLHLACESGQELVVGWLLEHGAAANKTVANGFAPLMLAARSGTASRPIMRVLLEHGATLDPVNANHETVLDCALHAGNWDCVDSLLDAGAKPSADAKACLFLATEAAQGNLPKGVLPYLLGRLMKNGGADIKDAEGTTLLIWCVRAGDADAVRVVLKAGADAKVPDAAGCTPLHWAAIVGSEEMEKLLVDARAKPDVVDASGRRATEYAALGRIPEGERAEDKTLIRPSETVTEDGETELFMAIQAKNPARIRAIVSKRATALGEKRGSLQPLQWAAMIGWEEGVQLLLDLGAAGLLQEDAESPAVLAAGNGHAEIAIRLLKSKGPEIDESAAATVYLAALGNDQLGAVRQLLAAGVPPGSAAQEALNQAAEKNDVDLCKMLLAAGASVLGKAEQSAPGNGRGDWYREPSLNALGYAASGDAEDVLRLLLKEVKTLPETERNGTMADALCAASGAGALKTAAILLKEEHVDPNEGLTPGKYSTPPDAALSKAVAGGHAVMVELLLKFGAQVATAEAASGSLLARAMRAEHRDIFFVMLRNGADVNAIDERWASKPLLHVAVELWDEELVRTLVDAGADPEVRDSQQETTVEVARQQGRVGLARWLEHEILKRTPKAKAPEKSSQKQ